MFLIILIVLLVWEALLNPLGVELDGLLSRPGLEVQPPKEFFGKVKPLGVVGLHWSIFNLRFGKTNHQGLSYKFVRNYF